MYKNAFAEVLWPPDKTLETPFGGLDETFNASEEYNSIWYLRYNHTLGLIRIWFVIIFIFYGLRHLFHSADDGPESIG